MQLLILHKLMNMQVYVTIIFAACAISPILAQSEEISNGTCPIVTVQANFSSTKFEGKWYEVKRFVNTLVTGDCGSPTYKWLTNQYNVSYPIRNLTNGNSSTLTLQVRNQIVVSPGKYDVYRSGKKELIPHFVLETDYQNYSIVWGCSLRSGKNIQRLFVYSRRNTMDDKTFTKVKQTLAKFSIDAKKLRNVEQDNKKCKRS